MKNSLTKLLLTGIIICFYSSNLIAQDADQPYYMTTNGTSGEYIKNTKNVNFDGSTLPYGVGIWASSKLMFASFNTSGLDENISFTDLTVDGDLWISSGKSLYAGIIRSDKIYSSNGLTFSTNNNSVNAMYINNLGQIGIGTTDIDTRVKLQVNGSLMLGQDGDMYNLDIIQGYDDLRFRGSVASGDADRTDLYIAENGKVGIGITSSDFNAQLQVAGSDNDGTKAALIVQNVSGTQKMLIDGNEIDALASVLYLQNNTYRNVSLARGGGKVAIGHDLPTEMLDVAGNIKANGIVLNIGTFPDYVFADTYQLMPLNDVETFIKANKHLPNVPSEKEIIKNGVDLGQINNILVEKVEELTLYTIAQEKEIDTQKSEVEELRTEIEELKDMMSQLLNK